jgi:hypothetical protein
LRLLKKWLKNSTSSLSMAFASDDMVVLERKRHFFSSLSLPRGVHSGPVLALAARFLLASPPRLPLEFLAISSGTSGRPADA